MLGVHEVAGSNPVAPTNSSIAVQSPYCSGRSDLAAAAADLPFGYRAYTRFPNSGAHLIRSATGASAALARSLVQIQSHRPVLRSQFSRRCSTRLRKVESGRLGLRSL